MQDSIVIKALKKCYVKSEGNFALDAINLSLKSPQLIIVSGNNGSGKSTLCNILSSYDLDYEGDVIVDGKELKSLTNKELCNYRRHVFSYVMQKSTFIDDLDVIDNCLLICDEIKLINSVLEDIGILDLAHKKLKELSGGQIQKCAIARAILQNAKILCFDEPLNAIDELSKNTIINQIIECAKSKTVIVVTHDIQSFENCNYRLIELNKGVIINDEQKSH